MQRITVHACAQALIRGTKCSLPFKAVSLSDLRFNNLVELLLGKEHKSCWRLLDDWIPLGFFIFQKLPRRIPASPSITGQFCFLQRLQLPGFCSGKLGFSLSACQSPQTGMVVCLQVYFPEKSRKNCSCSSCSASHLSSILFLCICRNHLYFCIEMMTARK